MTIRTRPRGFQPRNAITWKRNIAATWRRVSPPIMNIFCERSSPPQVLLLTMIKLLMLSGQLGYLFWLPSAIEKAKTSSHLITSLLYMIPFVVGAVSLVLISQSSDKKNERRGHVAFAMAIGGLALFGGVLTNEVSPIFSYALVCLAAVGGLCATGSFLGDSYGSVLPQNGWIRRGIYQTAIGNLGRFFLALSWWGI